MKGQRLFIRDGREDDRDDISSLLEGPFPVSDGLQWIVAKLVGDLVAAAGFVVATEPELVALSVREDLRRKRVGRYLLTEVEKRVAAAGARRLVIRKGLLPESFLARAGYDFHDGSFVKELENQNPA